MIAYDVTFKIPNKIINGLANGSFVQNGGVIQKTNGQVVTWLKEIGPLKENLINGLPVNSPGTLQSVDKILNLSYLSVGLQVATLSLTVMSFIIINRKLNQIQESLKIIGKKLDVLLKNVEWITKMFDIQILAEFKTANELAIMAVNTSDKNLRFERFVTAQEKYIESSHKYYGFMVNYLDEKKIIIEPELFEQYYRAWIAARLGAIQCSLYMEDTEIANELIRKLVVDQQTIITILRNTLGVFENIPSELLTTANKNFDELIGIKQQNLETEKLLLGYQSELNFITEGNISYEEWIKIGDSETEKDLCFIIPKGK